MAHIQPSIGGTSDAADLLPNREEPNQSKKRCDTIITVVLLVLFVVSICLSAYFSVHPFGPTIPNTTMSLPLLVSLGGTVGFGIGFLVLFIRCVNLEQKNSNLEQRISKLEKDLGIRQ